VAAALRCGRSTVATHLKHIRAKAGVHTSAQLVAWGLRTGEIEQVPRSGDGTVRGGLA
jgi:DNA-binding CsgD family transcriptional regulator